MGYQEQVHWNGNQGRGELERSCFVSQLVLLSTECRILNVDRKGQESKFIPLRESHSPRTTSVISKYPECRLWQVLYVQ